MAEHDDVVSVRYIVDDDVQASMDFYTTHFGFTVNSAHPPAFADVVRGRLRLLLSGPGSSGHNATPPGTPPGRNRIHIVVDDLEAEAERLRSAGLDFRSDVVEGPGGRQFLVADPAGNLVEVFTPAR